MSGIRTSVITHDASSNWRDLKKSAAEANVLTV
jgi:hypothetical protein